MSVTHSENPEDINPRPPTEVIHTTLGSTEAIKIVDLLRELKPKEITSEMLVTDIHISVGRGVINCCVTYIEDV